MGENPSFSGPYVEEDPYVEGSVYVEEAVYIEEGPILQVARRPYCPRAHLLKRSTVPGC
jgi:hypothetical protein